MRSRPSPLETRATAVGALGLVIAALPVFLVGGLAVQIRADLGFSETAHGAAVTAFFVAAGLGSVPGGRLSDRMGARRSMLAGSGGTAAGLLVIATADSLAVIAAGLALSGLFLGLTEPGIAAILARLVPAGRQGLAFGIKEAAIPGATLLAGIAVPAIALTVGWRWAFGAATLLVPVLWAVVPDDRARAAPGSSAPAVSSPAASAPVASPPTWPLAVVALGSGFGVAAVTAMSAFLVEAAVVVGLGPGQAGLLLSVGSAGGVAGRVGVGWLADRRPKPQLPVVAAMLIGGAGALGLLALAGSAASPQGGLLLVVGTLLAFSVGWGWTGLLFLSAVRASPAAPAGAAGIALAGLSVGGAAGPLLFGVLVARVSFPAAWTAGAGAMLVGAVLVTLGARMLPAHAEVEGGGG